MVGRDDDRAVLGDVLAADPVLAEPDQEEREEQQPHDAEDEAIDAALAGTVEQLLLIHAGDTAGWRMGYT